MVVPNQHSLVRQKGPFLGADLHPGSQGAEGGSKARSGTGATRSEREHGEDPPFDASEHPAAIEGRRADFPPLSVARVVESVLGTAFKKRVTLIFQSSGSMQVRTLSRKYSSSRMP